MSESSYVPSEFSEAPWGYVCKMGMPEFDTDDISKMPLDIVDEYLASLVFEAQELITNHTLFPTDIENRLRSSAILPQMMKLLKLRR